MVKATTFWWALASAAVGIGIPSSTIGQQADDQTKCPLGPYHFGPGRGDVCDVFHFWSRHSGGANFAFADGSVRFLSYSADSILPALATRMGGETVQVPD